MENLMSTVFLITVLQLYYNINANDFAKSAAIETAAKTFKNISDAMIVVAAKTFINDNGLRRSGDVVQSLRMRPKYYPPSERALNLRILDMMRQAIYDSQYNMKNLEPILEKYKDNLALKMAFMFNRLRQLIIDIRRVYTLAIKWPRKWRVIKHIIWHTYCARKHVDVLYIVEHLIEAHDHDMKRSKKE